MILLKPYAWLDVEARTAQYKIRLKQGSTAYTVDSVTTDDTDAFVYLITVKVISGTGPEGYEGATTIPSGTTHKKIRVQVVLGSTIKGSVTLRINKAFFDDPLKPLSWLKMTSVPNTELHLLPVYQDGSTTFRLTGTYTLDRDVDAHKITVSCPVTTGSGMSSELIVSFSEEDMSLFEFVEVELKEGSTPKGKGTTTQSEADSSSDT